MAALCNSRTAHLNALTGGATDAQFVGHSLARCRVARGQVGAAHPACRRVAPACMTVVGKADGRIVRGMQLVRADEVNM